MNHSTKTAKLKLVPPKARFEAFAGGNQPDESMLPDKYVAACERIEFPDSHPKYLLLIFDVAEGPHTGTELPLWIPVPKGGLIKSLSKYYQHCQIALGRRLNRNEDLSDPESIFVGKIFVVDVGYSMKRLDGRNSPTYALTKKYPGDFLRVHRIIKVISDGILPNQENPSYRW